MVVLMKDNFLFLGIKFVWLQYDIEQFKFDFSIMIYSALELPLLVQFRNPHFVSPHSFYILWVNPVSHDLLTLLGLLIASINSI